MSGFFFELAGPADDEEIRRLLAAEPVPGAITVRYEREPSYFAGCRVMAPAWQVLVCRELETRVLAGVAFRGVRRLFVNGEPASIGYLGQLRIASAFRGRALLRRGFAALRPMMEDGVVSGHVTTIIERNLEATHLLVDGSRPGLPRYRRAGTLETLVLAARSVRARSPAGCELESGLAAPLDEILAFLNRENARRQFAPVHVADVFAGESASTPGFRLEDLLVVRRHGAIVGTLGLWDQSAFKQATVTGYSPALVVARRALNLLAPLTRRPRLPPPGTRLRDAYACFLAVADDDQQVFEWLLRLVLSRAKRRGVDYVLLGLDAADPLVPAARRLRPVVYPARVYTVAWGEDALRASLDGRPSRLEVATL